MFSEIAVLWCHHTSLCVHIHYFHHLFSLMSHLFLLSLSLSRNADLVCPSLLVIITNFFHNFSAAVHSVIALLLFHRVMYLTWADLLMDLCPRSCWTSILLLPKIAVTLKFGWYLGLKTAASGSLTNTMSFTLKLWGSSSFFGNFSLALRMFCTTIVYNLLNVSIFNARPHSP